MYAGENMNDMRDKIAELEAQLTQTQKQLASAKVFVKAVAHIGVDFEHDYKITQTDITNARGFIEKLEGKS